MPADAFLQYSEHWIPSCSLCRAHVQPCPDSIHRLVIMYRQDGLLLLIRYPDILSIVFQQMVVRLLKQGFRRKRRLIASIVSWEADIVQLLIPDIRNLPDNSPLDNCNRFHKLQYQFSCWGHRCICYMVTLLMLWWILPGVWVVLYNVCVRCPGAG